MSGQNYLYVEGGRTIENQGTVTVVPGSSASEFVLRGGTLQNDNGATINFADKTGFVTSVFVFDGTTNAFVNALAIDPSAPDTVYAGTEGGGVFKSTDGGASWLPTGGN